MKQLIEDLISALEYHVEQTRPIYSTAVALQAARKALKSLPPQRTWVGLTDEEVKQSYRQKCSEFGHWLDERTFLIACNWAETKLKDKNNA